MEQLSRILEKQRQFFRSHATKAIPFRLKMLKNLYETMDLFEPELLQALKNDLGKSAFEAYASEIGLVRKEIRIQIRHLKRWAKPQRVRTPLLHFISSSYIVPEPYGLVLIISPWNYPVLLSIPALAGAIAAGNCVALKPSRHAPETQKVMEKIIQHAFPPEWVSFFKGGQEINEKLLQETFDYIFFTGSTATGKKVMENASRNLTPVSLELGGKSPCIVDEDADLATAAKRIVWGKFMNCGQTCIAPDYLLVHHSIKDKFNDHLVLVLKSYFGNDPLTSPDYPRLINRQHVQRIESFLTSGKIIYGGIVDKDKNYFAPTLLDEVKPEDPVMQDEIFGPVLPVFRFSDLSEAIAFANDRPKPLALYYFGKNRKKQKRILKETTSGGVCINDTVMHIVNPWLPFGGVGTSGMGRYHGKYTFTTFSNMKSVIHKLNYPDIPLRYPPYKGKLKWIKLLLR